MTEPIPVRVTRYRCPFCNRSHSSKTRCGQHISRCWSNPEARGCKTCKHFEPYRFLIDEPESCAVGVDLTGRPECERCAGRGEIYIGNVLYGDGGGVSECPECGGDGAEIKPGPIVGCSEWEAAS